MIDDYYKNAMYIYVNDDFVHGDSKEVVKSQDQKSLTYTFEMTSADLSVYLVMNNTRRTDGTGISIKVADNDNIKVLGFEDGDLYDGGRTTLSYVKTAGFVIDEISILYEGSETPTTMMFQENSLSSTTGVIQLYSPLTNSCTITITGEVHDIYKINYVGLDQVEIGNYAPFEFATEGVEGQVIEVSNIVAVEENHRISSIKIEGIDTETDPNYYVNTSGSGARYAFTMPSGEVTITFEVVENGSLTVSENEQLASYKFLSSSTPSSSEVTNFAPGSYVYLHLEAIEGYVIKGIKDQNDKTYAVTKASIYDYKSGGNVFVQYAMIQMPQDGSSLTLTVETGVGYSVALPTDSSDYRVSLSNAGTSFAEGETIRFNVTVTNNKKEISEVYLSDGEGTRLDVKLDGTISGSTYSGSFAMPAQNVRVNVVLEDKEMIPTAVTVVNESSATSVAEIFSQFNISNYQSSVNINQYSDDINCEFVEGTNTNVTLGLKGSYSASVSYVYEGGTETPFYKNSIYSDSTGNRIYAFSSPVTTTDVKGIKIVISDLEPLNVSLIDETGDGLTLNDFTFTKGGEEISSTEIYEGDAIGVALNKTADDGYAYTFTLENNENEEIHGYGTYRVNEDFKIVVKKVQTYTISIENSTDLYVDLMDTNYKSYSDGDVITQQGLIGRVSLSSSSSSGVSVHVKVTVGDTVKVDETVQVTYYGYMTNSFTIDGDVTVVVTAAE